MEINLIYINFRIISTVLGFVNSNLIKYFVIISNVIALGKIMQNQNYDRRLKIFAI